MQAKALPSSVIVRSARNETISCTMIAGARKDLRRSLRFLAITPDAALPHNESVLIGNERCETGSFTTLIIEHYRIAQE